MSWLSNLLHPGRAYKDASQTTQNYYNQGQGYLNPYNQTGQNANNKLTQMMEALSNPGKLQDEWGQNYKESEHAKGLEQGAMDRGLNSAGSMGLMGSSAALNNIQNESTGIMNADKQQYMNDLMQKYLTAIGVGQGQAGLGAGAAGQMSNNANNQGTTQANLGFGQSQAGPNMITGGLGAIMKFIESLETGGMSNLFNGMGGGGSGGGMFTPPGGANLPTPSFNGGY